MKLTRILGQPSWQFACDKVDAAITEQGGHLAPVRFKLPGKTVQPYSIAPWAEEKVDPSTPPLLRSLRGDFFCAPFGGNDRPYRGEKHPAHGETAQSKWKLESFKKTPAETKLQLAMKLKVRPGRVDKTIRLRQGETAVYCRHVISGMTGRMAPGHHATLKFPDDAGSGLIDTSPISHGQVLPIPFELPSNGGYNSLKVGATFSALQKVPSADGTTVDLSVYPARRGFEDLVMITHEATPDFAWTSVTFPKEGYVWFALKDPRVLRSTVLWISNGGRHYAPWNGRHISVMGLEDVTAYFHLGLAESAAPNPISKRGIATSFDLKPSTPLVINYIMGVAAIPPKWGRVKTIVANPKGITIHGTKGAALSSPLDTNFLYSENP